MKKIIVFLMFLSWQVFGADSVVVESHQRVEIAGEVSQERVLDLSEIDSDIAQYMKNQQDLQAYKNSLVDAQESLDQSQDAHKNLKIEWVSIESDIGEIKSKIEQFEQEIENKQGVVSSCDAELEQLTQEQQEEEKESQRLRSIVVTYPNCKDLKIVRCYYESCPSGYSGSKCHDMIESSGSTHEDDVALCTKLIPPGEELFECYSGGYYIEPAFYGAFGSNKITVPKGASARIRITNVYYQTVVGTIINKTLNTVLRDHVSFVEGDIVEIVPYVEDQQIEFYFNSTNRLGTFFFDINKKRTGVMTLYIDHESKDIEAVSQAEHKEKVVIPKIQQKIDDLIGKKDNQIEEITGVMEGVESLKNDLQRYEEQSNNIDSEIKKLEQSISSKDDEIKDLKLIITNTEEQISKPEFNS